MTHFNRIIALSIMTSGLFLLAVCQSESKVKEAPAVCTAIANCQECDAEGTQCNVCEEGFTWNETECAQNAPSGTICAGGPSQVISYTDANGVLHYHCLKK